MKRQELRNSYLKTIELLNYDTNKSYEELEEYIICAFKENGVNYDDRDVSILIKWISKYNLPDKTFRAEDPPRVKK